MQENNVSIISKCCGCGTCALVCPTNAISLQKNEYGFIVPKVCFDLCIQCGRCLKKCAYSRSILNNSPLEVYAVAANDDICNSASGGAFATAAKAIINLGGVVYGAAYNCLGENISVGHRRVDALTELQPLLGSKYVQSNASLVYKSVRDDLNNNVLVLFSGTPCQVDALYSFLGKEYNNLFTMDLICHGVPSEQFFQDYCSSAEKQFRFRITKVKFRDKKFGWNLFGSIEGNRRGKIISIPLLENQSSYYHLFLHGLSYRDCCYECKYASNNRVGDITIGDYWGIKKQHPEFFDKEDIFDEKKGISCLIVNTEKGSNLFWLLSDNVKFARSSIEKVSANNKQLNEPSVWTETRDEVLGIYKSRGYKAVEKWFAKRQGRAYIKQTVKLSLKSLLTKLVW